LENLVLRGNAQTQGRSEDNPYAELFIYNLEGRVRDEDEPTLGENFLGNWVEGNTSFLFFSLPSPELVSQLLNRRPELKSIEDYHLTYEQWQGGSLKPFVIGHFLIQPPWEEVDADEGKVKIILDPGVVFGTGLHPTTRDCLKAMVRVHRQFPVQRVLDLGTGTGILALAAAILGAKEVLAVDLNPLSVKTAQRNIRLNGHEGSIKVVKGDAEDFVNEAADLVVANLQHGVIVKLLENRGFQEKNWVIISGLLRSEAREIKSQLGKYNLHLIYEWDHEGTWYTLLVRNSHVAVTEKID
jgi:ribosomal protein L11 methyltransferase